MRHRIETISVQFMLAFHPYVGMSLYFILILNGLPLFANVKSDPEIMD